MQDTQPKKQPPLPETPKEVREPYFVSGTKWMWGFNPSAEIWNGRLAMIGFLAAALIEITTGYGFLHFWGLLSNSPVVPPQF